MRKRLIVHAGAHKPGSTYHSPASASTDVALDEKWRIRVTVTAFKEDCSYYARAACARLRPVFSRTTPVAVSPPAEFPPLPAEVGVILLPAASPGGPAAAARAVPALAAVVITYQRPLGLRQLFASLLEQTTLPANVVVVDNGGNPDTERDVRDLAANGCRVALLTPPRNLGPAGATALAMTWILDEVSLPAQWLTILNDDLVFSHPRILEEMLGFAEASAREDPTLAAVGRIGHRYDRAWARLWRPPEATGAAFAPAIDVDYLTTGSARESIGQPVPMFRLAAVRDVGPFWADLFIGMTEVEFGLRLRRHGYRLLANGEMWLQRRPAIVLADPPKVVRTPRRRYYSTRNLLVIARVYGRWWTAAWVTVSRLGARLLVLLRRPNRSAWAHLRVTVIGIADGWRTRLGERIV